MSSVRVSEVPLIPGCCIVGTTGLGVRATDLPGYGPDGQPLSKLWVDQTDADKEVRWHIVRRPELGELSLFENGTVVFANAPEGTYSFDVVGFVDGVQVGLPQTVVVHVGPLPAAVRLRLSLT